MPSSSTLEPKDTFACGGDMGTTTACAGEGRYKVLDGKQYCVLHYPGSGKEQPFQAALLRKLEAKDLNFVSLYFPDDISFKGFEFNGDVDFQFATFSKNVDFYGVRFNGQANFENAVFQGEAKFESAVFKEQATFFGVKYGSMADYTDAKFHDLSRFHSATFEKNSFFRRTLFATDTYFGEAKFGGTADFFGVRFSGLSYFSGCSFAARADFGNVSFDGEACFDDVVFSAHVEFNYSTFKAQADFKKAVFKTEVDFSYVDFGSGVNFGEASFGDYVKFAGDDETKVFSGSSSLDLQHARLEKPQRVSFHTLSLHPHWFVNVDPRKFEFTNVEWVNSDNAKAELDCLAQKEVPSAYRLLAIAGHRLASNAEENDRYRLASHFRRMSMDAERLERWRGLGFLQLGWWYWLASGYGERPSQALIVLLGLLFLFALSYTQVGFARWEPRVASQADAATSSPDRVGAPLRLARALTYSAGVMTLQRPEPRPATATAQTLVLLETVFGPVQAALLALAIRRKFMR